MIDGPFLLIPAEKNYLWGGRRLAKEFNKPFGTRIVAESWECSTHPDGLSIIGSGPYKGRTLKEYLQENPSALGLKCKGMNDLPILVKLIDANQDLSIQVHPNDEFASIHENGQRGKQEVWYFLDAEAGTSAFFGLNHNSDREEIARLLEQSKIEDALQRIPIHAGDVFFIKPGTVHALGKGGLILEVQDNSNVTYRVYDYDRVDFNGNPRRLDVEKALSVMNYNRAPLPRQPIRIFRHFRDYYQETLARCDSFQIDLLRMGIRGTQSKVAFCVDDYSFEVLLCLDGETCIGWNNGRVNLKKGQTLFVPAGTLFHTVGRSTLALVRV